MQVAFYCFISNCTDDFCSNLFTNSTAIIPSVFFNFIFYLH